MSSLTLPTGTLPTLPVDPITSDRAAAWRIDLLDNAMAPAGVGAGDLFIRADGSHPTRRGHRAIEGRIIPAISRLRSP